MPENIGKKLPGLAKAEGREGAVDAAPEESTETPDVSKLVDQVEAMQAELAGQTEAFAAERAALNSDLRRSREKFNALDRELGRYQTAVAQLVAEADEEKRKAIRDSLAN